MLNVVLAAALDVAAMHPEISWSVMHPIAVEPITRIFLEEHRRLGKRLIFRSFGSIKSDYEDLIAGANACAADYDFEIETKITPFDFSPFLPANPYLGKTSRCTIGAECDCLGEYLGAGYLPAAQVDAVARYVGCGRAANVDRYTIRIDRVGNSIFDSAQEVNLCAYMRFIRDSSATAETVLGEWAARRWTSCARSRRTSRVGFSSTRSASSPRTSRRSPATSRRTSSRAPWTGSAGSAKPSTRRRNTRTS